VFGMTNNLLVGYTKQDESRAQINCSPSSSSAGDGSPMTSFDRAVHAVQPALLSHVPDAGQRDDVQEEPLDTFGGNLESSTRTTLFYFGIRAPILAPRCRFYADANGFSRTRPPVSPVR
jgi:hypothetical protein